MRGWFAWKKLRWCRHLAASLRILVVAGASIAALGSSSSQHTQRAVGQDGVPPAPPQPRALAEGAAEGLWKSSFGAVKIERDTSQSGPGVQLMGVWVYQSRGAEVVGYFEGPLRGNVLSFSWHEPGTPSALRGNGYLVFDDRSAKFTGKWWTHNRDRGGEWNGWRADARPDDG